MRIAVCLSGQPRSYKLVSRGILSLFSSEDFEVDYYIHVWSNNRSYTTVFDSVDYEEDITTLESNLKRLYSPKQLHIQDEELVQETLRCVYPECISRVQEELQGSLGGSFSMIASLRTMLDYSDLEYDFVFWIRIDTLVWRDTDDRESRLPSINWRVLQEMISKEQGTTGFEYSLFFTELPLLAEFNFHRFTVKDQIWAARMPAVRVLAENYLRDWMSIRVLTADGGETGFRAAHNPSCEFIEEILPISMSIHSLGARLFPDGFFDGGIFYLPGRVKVLEVVGDPWNSKALGFVCNYSRIHMFNIPKRTVRQLWKLWKDYNILVSEIQELDQKYTFNDELAQLDCREIVNLVDKRVVEVQHKNIV